ncbi:hypothetical protein Z042_06905 [Chania multitudinisentens RB-25]|uniref:DUF2877 domain-containing protein n=1 Tax=Chania multitudinisentens RB-25 TaxID=1441930 RepID=W0L6H3_9GAMM|nr:DUF2877 domain-containing protein [Chania multitudinisentens]AHG19378.1 hypothetical protein Z042_06905 [Chania multitudinisentens RB-25]
MNINALTFSVHATQDYGPLRCAGRFNNAINFLSQSGHLLTLHRENHGISPMGWEIRDDDFDKVFDSQPLAQRCQLSPLGLQLEDTFISRQGSRLNLHLNQKGEILLAPLDAALADETAHTGLFGRLEQIVGHPLCLEARELQLRFLRWLQGQQVDWSTQLGKGPGLTPSNDDTLVGMLLSAHLDSRVEVARLPAFFSGSQPLSQLTTLVSAHYLQFAEQGIFSTPLQTLAHALLQPSQLPDAIRDLLDIGHFSGADTLLGIWLGVMAIDRLY